MVETSIIIPAYNVSSYLEKCVNSVLIQKRNDLEVIIVNDGSLDNTPEICEKLRTQDPRVRVIHKENGGLSSARNAGIAASVGQYLMFLDGDDWLWDNCLEDLHRIREQSGADIAIGNYSRFDPTTSKFYFYSTDDTYFEKVFTPDELFSQVYGNGELMYVVAWGKLYRRELFEHVMYPLGVITEDDYTTWKLYLLADKIAVINKAEYVYRKNEEGIMATSKKYQLYQLKSLEQRIAIKTMLGMDTTGEIGVYKYRMGIREQDLLKHGSQNIQDYQEIMWLKQLLKKYDKE